MSELEQMPEQMPERLGSYRLVDRIGEGGMGVVFLAHDSSRRPVAIKVLRPVVAGETTARLRLAREVQTMRRVRSPYVAEVIDADLSGQVPYIVTRYVPGHTLDQVIGAGGPLRGIALARLAHGLAEALVAVHAAGVVHRDLKPGNVMLVGDTPVVIDFGIAQGADTTRLTLTGMFMGTPGYLSPEVIDGQPSSQASDVHAWGATVAFAATGRPPFGTGPYETIFYRILNGHADLAGAPAPLLPAIAAALSKDPAARPSAAALSAQAAVLDPASLIPAPVLPAGETGLAQATRADLAAGGFAPSPQHGGGMAGWAGGVQIGPDGLPATSAEQMAASRMAPGSPQAPAPGPEWNGTRPLAAPGDGPADSFSDLLPPARYEQAGRPGEAPPAGMPPLGGRFPAGARADPLGRRAHGLLVVAAMVTLAAVSVILPVAGALAAVALIVMLRGGELAHNATVRRRSRGTRVSDLFVTALSFPWFVVRSVVACVVLVPFAAATGVIAGGISIAASQGQSLARALAYGAGALVAFYGIGPGSSRSRRQLGRLLGTLTRTRLSEVLILTGMVVLAIAAIAAAVSWPSWYWPTQPPHRFVHIGVLPGGPVHRFGLVARYFLARFSGH